MKKLLTGHFLFEFFRRRKIYRKYNRPKHYDYNLVVIGGGSAGLSAASTAISLQARIALIEREKMGGDRLHTGCVPSKALIRSAKVFAEEARAESLGFRKITPDFDFKEVMGRIQKVIQKIQPYDSPERYTWRGVDCYHGDAHVLDPFTVSVNGKIITTRNILLATGARPTVPPIKGLEKITCLTSDNLWHLETLPGRLVVLGGGAIGCEIAQSFARFGSRVIQIERGPRILGREDAEVTEIIAPRFKSEGVEIRTSTEAKEVVLENGKRTLICNHQGHEERIEFDEIFIALGRKPNVEGFGLEALGVTLSTKGTIHADNFLRTNYPNIFVSGDATGPLQFSHTAAHQAWKAVHNALFSPFKSYKIEEKVVPWCTFTDPEVARVGLNEVEARANKIPFEATLFPFGALDRALTDEEPLGFVKVVTAPGKDKVLGATIVGTRAGEMILEYVTAMKYGIGLKKILDTIHIYPTFGEANWYAAKAHSKSHISASRLNRLRKFHEWRRGERFLPF